MTHEKVLPELLEAFKQDHAMLGRGFNRLSCCLRAGDLAGARAAALQLREEAGAHIGFEEEDFYPTLVPLLGEETVRRMRQEHCCGFDVIYTLLSRDQDLPLHPDLGERLLAQSEVMEEHIAECGELFAAMRDIPPAKQQTLYDRLIEWRRHPKLDLECRTVGCGVLRLAQCHPAAMPRDAFERSSVPVSKGLPVRVGSDERRELTRMAARLIAEDPALVSNDALDPRTGSGIENGPALFYEDHSEIPLRSGACLDYRSRLLAGDGDTVMIGGQRRPEFEAYCRDLLGIGDAAIVVPKGPLYLPLAKRCARDSALMAQICAVARRAGRLGLVPYLSSDSAWMLASTIARQSGAPVWVAGPGPRLTRRVNDKLWFSERVAQVLGRRALPQTHYIFGPEALARRIARLAQDHHCVCVKVPDAAGGAGNLVLEAKQVTGLLLTPLRQFLLQRLYELGWRGRYPLLVGSWESPIIASPSVQLWIPHRTLGGPVAEAVFEQIVEAGRFVGATQSALPASWHQRVAQEAVHLCCLFQELGYFGRCSLDAVLLDSGALQWIECNGRWGGVSIPMTLLTRLFGDSQRSFVMVQRSGMRIPARSFADVVDRLKGRLFCRGGEPKGLIFLTADEIEQGTGFHFLVVGNTEAEILSEAREIARLLQGDEIGDFSECADFTDSERPN
jgi:Pre ATP-grasp domain/Hemerythrin HHE cation binding domain